MSDQWDDATLVNRLRALNHGDTLGPYPLTMEAADEIERLHNAAHSCAAVIGGLEAEIARLRDLAADLMDLVNGMPIKHPQQATRRKILNEQCQSFGVK